MSYYCMIIDITDREWLPRGGEIDKPTRPWGGDLDTGKSGLAVAQSDCLPYTHLSRDHATVLAQ